MRSNLRLSFHEPTNEHAAPTELGEGPRGIGSYRHGAPTELFKPVHGPNACARRNESHPLPTSKVVELIKIFAIIATGFAMVGVARGATASFSTNPPLLGSVIISNLTGAVAPGGSMVCNCGPRK